MIEIDDDPSGSEMAADEEPTQAELILNGDVCRGCGTDLGAGDGYPRSCGDCR